MNRAARQSQRASDLEKMQDGVKAKIQDLEDSYIAKAAEHQKTVQQLQREKSEAQKRCELLEEKLSENGNVISQLQKQLNVALNEDDKRIARQNRIFEQFHKRAARSHSVADQQPKENKKGENKKISENNEYLLESEYPIILKVLNGIKAIVYRNGVSFESQKESNLQAVENADYGDLLPTIELWAEQLAGLKQLQHALQKLLVRLDPYDSIKRIFDENDGVKVEELLHTVEMMLQVTEEEEINSNVIGKPSQPTLLAIVSHFQKLFDVKSISGVYPRMNEVYTKLGEMTNTMRNLQELFDLGLLICTGIWKVAGSNCITAKRDPTLLSP
ncbi:CEP70 protein, partial [Polypterus senegalus]